MKRVTFKIPEVEHLPLEQRKEILERCIAHPKMQRYRRLLNPLVGLVPIVIGLAFLTLSVLRWHWSFTRTTLTFLGIVVGGMVILNAAKLGGEIWIVRRLARRELTRVSPR